MGEGGLRRELAGIALLLFALFLLGALLVAPDVATGASCTSARGGFGPVGACLRSGLFTLLGAPAALLVPLAPAVHALRLFGRLESDTDRSWMVFLAGLAALLPVALGLARDAGPPAFDPMAGVWGGFAAYYLTRAFGSVGGWIVLAIAVSALAAATLRWNPVRALVGPSPATDGDGRTTRARDRRSRATSADLATQLAPTPEEMPAIDPALVAGGAGVVEEGGSDEEQPSRRRRDRKRGAATTDDVAGFAAELDAASDDSPGAQELPSAELLSPAPPSDVEANRRELDAMGEKLMDALRTFRVDGELVGRTTGPVVTQFEIEPAPGVKVRQFANLSNDLALAMRAPSIRIVAPIPGRGAVGVEVPNPVAEIVAFRDLIEVREFQQARAALPIALGKNLEGKAVVADLAKMPHLLIAGATGSGKSVCVNTLITSLVYRHTPRTLRFLMVDPKMVELSVYNDLPHLKYRVVTDNRDAAAVLKWAVMEMQDRYALLAANGCRNIQDFNRRVADGASLEKPKNLDVAFENTRWTDGVLPYIVVVIDELADLMMTVQGEVETPLAMLAQKARAIGIHLILATQRPSVNVITGLIKANFPSRIAFRVASQVDSRTIIDGVGAETLLGNGDMLFIPPGKSEPQRLQGAFISSEDTERVMGWYAGRREALRAARAERGAPEEPVAAEPDILELVRQKEALDAQGTSGDDDGDGEGSARDKLFREAAEVVIHNQHGSTSLLQRRLGIGYGRAARIIDQLHAAGVLGPPNGSKPRDILVGLEELDRIDRS
ncbi:MAG TPA: DNA translocase FtsK [Gemmatimonadaceae bacterium]|nr:DNA translocase FtsK [Gemmatimonadaceae bacterium]